LTALSFSANTFGLFFVLREKWLISTHDGEKKRGKLREISPLSRGFESYPYSLHYYVEIGRLAIRI
jgi:hypothetical protein